MTNPFNLTDEQVMEIANQKFQDWYIAQTTVEDLRPQVYGLLLANALRWDHRIIKACAHALEDANFHTEAGLMYDEWNKIEEAA